MKKERTFILDKLFNEIIEQTRLQNKVIFDPKKMEIINAEKVYKIKN